MLYAALFVGQLAIVTVSTPILTRLLPQSQFGLLAICMTVLQLLVVLTTWRMDLGVQRIFAENGDVMARKMLSAGMALAGGLFVIEFASGYLWAPALRLGSFEGALSTTVVWTLLTAATAPCLALLRSRDKLWQYGVVALIQTTLAEAFSVVLVLVVSRSAHDYVLGQTIAQAVALTAALIFTRPLLPRRADFALIAPALAYASTRLPAALVDLVDGSADRLIVNADLGHHQLSRYAIAGNIGGFVLMILYGISQSWMPRAMSIQDPAELRHIVSQARDRLTLLALPVVLALTAAAPILLRIWAPPSYAPDGLQVIVALTAFMVFPAIGDVSMWQLFAGAGKSKALPIVAVGTASLNIALNFALVPVIGLAGSVTATIAATSAEYIWLRRRLASDRKPSRPPLRLVGQTLAVCALGLGLCLLPTSLPFLGFRLLVAAVSCVVALMVFASFSDRNLSWLPSWLRPRNGRRAERVS